MHVEWTRSNLCYRGQVSLTLQPQGSTGGSAFTISHEDYYHSFLDGTVLVRHHCLVLLSADSGVMLIGFKSKWTVLSHCVNFGVVSSLCFGFFVSKVITAVPTS